ncbi:hypothetical protein RJ639_041180 [Escallonia herrerae]|uniref:Enhancer of polycomb-like protein n=1 Tax=Escallonia herrerae TaxID=1293975 RepID=A0AA88WJS8_9ASTE|nr:hypothetical protein RJ639_041180 [Escallonia herrerae]
MEISVVKGRGGVNSKKNRSVGVQSNFKLKASNEVQNKEKGGVGDDEEVRKKKTKSRKEAPLSCSEPVAKKSRNSLGGAHVEGAILGSGQRARSQSGLSQKLNGGGGLNDISLNLGDNLSVVRIPKRRRGAVGRRKFESNYVRKPLESSSSVDQVAKLNGKPKKSESNEGLKKAEASDIKSITIDQIVKVNSNTPLKVVSPKVKQKKGFHDVKEDRTDSVNSGWHAKKEDSHLAANNGDTSSKKRQSSSRKRKDLSSGSGTVANKAKPLVDISVSSHGDYHDDDEENLEQNAARMLSSRFDPSCTGFSSTSRSSASPSASRLSFLISSGQNFASLEINSLVGSEAASADTASRVLRPRKQHKKGKGFSRKRRHFYEVLSRDLDVYWFLNRRIKVFWPLDESWYFGLVNDYDRERKLHHVKYDDRDEEWINLQNERFKLLLLPSEVPGRSEPKEIASGDSSTDMERRGPTMNDDTNVGSHMDSEPIISWLARYSRRVKSPSVALKKQKTSHLSPNPASPLPDSTGVAGGSGDKSLLKRDSSRPDCVSALADRLSDGGRGEMTMFGSTSGSKESKPVVYVRRRSRQSDIITENDNRRGSAHESVTTLPFVESFLTKEYDASLGCLDHEKQLLLMDNACTFKLNVRLLKSEDFRFKLLLPLCPLFGYIFGAETLWLCHTVLLLQCGTIVTTWPEVQLEMLFVDNIAGLRFFLFEGCLKQVVAFIFLVLRVFDEPNEQTYADMHMPVTSIRFKLSFSQDPRKQHVFAHCSFFKVNHCRWLYLDCKLQRHCSLAKRLPLRECTFDNIKSLEGGSKQLYSGSVGREPSFEGLQQSLMQGIIPMGACKESYNGKMSQTPDSDGKHVTLPLFALSFTAAPTFFLSLHLKLLIERSIACVSLQNKDPFYSIEHSGNLPSVADDCTQAERYSDNAPELTRKTGLFSCAKRQLSSNTVSVSIDDGHLKSTQNGKSMLTGTFDCSNGLVNTEVSEIIGDVLQSEQLAISPGPLVSNGHSPSVMPSGKRYCSLNDMSIDIPPFDQVESNSSRNTYSSQQAPRMARNMGDDIVCSPSHTGPRSFWHRNRNGSSSSSLGDLSHVWADGKNFIRNGFEIGPRKPRTQVRYTLPLAGFDISLKHKVHYQNGVPHKRIRRSNDKRLSDGSRSSHRNLELLACDANVLITLGDRGLRERGARVFLEPADTNEWKLAVKLSGTTKYSYNVHHVMQPGSTNRYTHAMMWKGGKDWALEFPDRSQWTLFKEMHEECHNRNIRAASVKNIPIPGVRLIEDSDDNPTEVSFVRSSAKYFRQVETDSEMAMDPSRILYDMDGDDEQWILSNKRLVQSQENKCLEISDELFEKTMDTFEKLAYGQQRDDFTADEIEDFMVGVGPMEVIKVIYEHWRQKRQRKGMPLIRQLQPPSWERYQQQLKEWEQSMTKANNALSGGCQEKTPPIEKPVPFAFCLKPRGLEVLNKGSKHRSYRRMPVSGHSHTVQGEDGLHAFGRRLNGWTLGDEKVMFLGNSNDSSEASPLFQASPRVYSPRDGGGPGHFSLSSDTTEWSHHSKLNRTKSKKIGTLISHSNPMMVPSYDQRRNGIHRWNTGLPEQPGQKHHQQEGSHRHGIEQLGGPDLDEFRLRDASGAAQHALNMAKLKRQNAQRLLYRADLAIHKAVVALMTADAVKASYDGSNGE